MSDKNNEMDADHKFYEGGWGNNICFFNLAEFDGWDGDLEKEFTISGHKTPLPKLGQTIVSEGDDYFTKFIISEIEPCGNPKDMFFGKVKAIEQVMKKEVTK